MEGGRGTDCKTGFIALGIFVGMKWVARDIRENFLEFLSDL
jgi:hypothetical protein